MDIEHGKSDNTLEKEGDCPTRMLQTVYDAIKRERPWDIRPVHKMYITAKEKYMIELIKEGHEFSNKTINHVVGRCYKFHEFGYGKHVCWYGFILSKKEYPAEHFQCKSFHKLNKRLICHNGAVYYPVDILSNPFGKWRPEETKMKPEIQNVYTMIREKWPDHWYENELHKYTLKHLINMIETGEALSEDIKRHVVDGCHSDNHILDVNYHCYSGFLLKQNQIVDTKCFDRFRDGILRYVMNPKFQDHTGVIWIPVSELRFRNYQTAQEVTNETIRPLPQSVKNIYDRIIQRDLICPKFVDKIRLTWQEKYLVDNVMVGEDIPNEVISHVLDGCYTWGHLVTENYACCRGYILARDIFSYHDVRCGSHHMINEDLNCYNGRIYHRHAEIPKGLSYGYHKLEIRPQLTVNPRLPPRPAPPPPDHLDNQPVQHPVAMNRQPNPVAENFRQNVNERDGGAVGAIVENVAPNRHQNAAPPPPEFDI